LAFDLLIMGGSVVTRDELMTYAQRARVNFLDCPLDALSMADTLEVIEMAVRGRTSLQHVVVNVAKLVSMHGDPDLRFDVSKSDLISIDGMGIVFGCRLFGIHVPERVTGIDLMAAVLDRCSREGWRPYFLGSQPDILSAAIQNIEHRFPGIRIAGYHHGYFQATAEEAIAEAIRAARPDCLFIAVSSPKKEQFMNKWKEALDVPFIMGVGGSIDVIAGSVKRAPRWMQVAGFEWLYRLAQEPRRMWRRYLGTNLAYAWMLIVAFLAHTRPASR
jgi:N-acetylglucosaminyldiphosphoundecaprenol N-acetyl-beta-D-mannosaminyltransferase